MRAGTFIFLYGALVLFGLFLSWFWGGLLWRRRSMVDETLLRDRYSIIACIIFLFAVGNLLQFTGRLIGNIMHGLSPILMRLEAVPIGIGLVAVLAACLLAVWLADLERQPPNWKWIKIGAIVTALWAAATVVIVEHVPLETRWPNRYL